MTTPGGDANLLVATTLQNKRGSLSSVLTCVVSGAARLTCKARAVKQQLQSNSSRPPHLLRYMALRALRFEDLQHICRVHISDKHCCDDAEAAAGWLCCQRGMAPRWLVVRRMVFGFVAPSTHATGAYG